MTRRGTTHDYASAEWAQLLRSPLLFFFFTELSGRTFFPPFLRLLTLSAAFTEQRSVHMFFFSSVSFFFFLVSVSVHLFSSCATSRKQLWLRSLVCAALSSWAIGCRCACVCAQNSFYGLCAMFSFFFSLTNSFLINCENRQKNAKSSAFHLFDVLSLGTVIRSTPNTYVVCKYELPVS